MALVNDAKKEIHAKIVYYGPGGVGKTTNLEFIYNKLKPEYRGKFKFLNTPNGKMVFFDFMRPELPGVRDYGIHFHIYTVPGDDVDVALWKNVLKGVDGIIFVADMDSSRTLENRGSLEDIKGYLAAYDLSIETVPCIFQFNKKDLSGTVSVEDLKNLLDTGDTPVMLAAASMGEGILPTLSEMVKMVLQRLRDTYLKQEEFFFDPSGEPVVDEDARSEREENSLSVDSAAFEGEIEDFESAAEEEAFPEDEVAEDLDLPLPEELDLSAAGMEDVSQSAGKLSDLEEGIFSEEAEALPADDMQGLDILEPEQDVTAFSPEPEAGSASMEDTLPSISLDGDLEALGDGRYRLPLVIRYADKETHTALTLSLGLE